MNAPRQTDFERETGLPRWGCFWLSLVIAAFHRWRLPLHEQVIAIYEQCIREGVLRVDVDDNYRLSLLDPSRAFNIALGYSAPDHAGRQYPDRETVHPSMYSQYKDAPGVLAAQPYSYELAYTLVAWRRSVAEGHWVLADAQGLNVVYNPDEDIRLDPWGRDGRWRGLQLWRKP